MSSITFRLADGTPHRLRLLDRIRRLIEAPRGHDRMMAMEDRLLSDIGLVSPRLPRRAKHAGFRSPWDLERAFRF